MREEVLRWWWLRRREPSDVRREKRLVLATVAVSAVSNSSWVSWKVQMGELLFRKARKERSNSDCGSSSSALRFWVAAAISAGGRWAIEECS